MIRLFLKIIKKTMIGILTIVTLATLGGAVFINLSPQFGGKSSALSLERIRKSPNFLNGAFKNQELTKQMTGFKWKTIPQFFTDGNNKTPSKELPMEKLKKSYFENEPLQPRITWFGHSAAFVEMEGINIFIEKPISMSTQSAERIILSSEKNRRVGAVGHIERFNAALVEAKAKLQRYKEGALKKKATEVDNLELMHAQSTFFGEREAQ